MKNLKQKLHSEEEHKRNSPWNIAANFDVEMSLSRQGIQGMLQEYEEECRTGMNQEEMADLLYKYTSGYPYLVSRLCKIMDEKAEKAWTKSGFLEAVRVLLSENNMLFESLTGKLADYPELSRVLKELLFSGKDITYNPTNPAINLAGMFGFVKNEGGKAVPANRIFDTLLYNHFLSEDEMRSLEIYKDTWRKEGNMKKTIIFDFDYTLGDSTDGIVASINFALEKMNLETASRDRIAKTIGLSLEESYQVLTGRTDSGEKARFKTYFREKADEVMVENTRLYDGVKEMLTQLHKKGKKTAIVTTKYRFRIEEILAVNQIEHFIDAIIGGEDVQSPKPDPEGIEKIKAQFGISPEDILYVGDSIVDAKTAQSAGVDFIAVLTGTTSAEDFQNYPCVKILNRAAELD